MEFGREKERRESERTGAVEPPCSTRGIGSRRSTNQRPAFVGGSVVRQDPSARRMKTKSRDRFGAKLTKDKEGQTKSDDKKCEAKPA